MTQSFVLHPEIFDLTPLFGRWQRTQLERRCQELARATNGAPDPNVTVLIRTRNDANGLRGLFEDLKAQTFDGRVEVIVVDTESSDGTVAIAKRNGAKVIPLRQVTFDYPTSLNVGFEAATHPLVFTFVGHSRLSNRLTLRAATRYANDKKFGGAFGFCLPNRNATRTERFGALFFRGVHSPAYVLAKPKMGMLAANCALVSRDVWQRLGGYDKAYGAGGEDGQLARRMMNADYRVVNEPVISVHHSHALGPIASIRQLRYWIKLAAPYRFDVSKLTRYRKDLQ